MQKSSIKKLSILGLVLVGASAVTAAVLPQNDIRDTETGNDRLIASSIGLGGLPDGQTCVPVDNDNDCNATANSETTASGFLTSSDNDPETTEGDYVNTTNEA